jgi:hypothetical protein
MQMVHRASVTYTDEINVVASEVSIGDLYQGLRVVASEPHPEGWWHIEANNGTDEDNPDAGIALDVTPTWPVTVTRLMTLGEDQCIVCKRHGIKYAAQHKCNACYQRERRHGLRAS